jgi:hypothetical protein
MHACIDTIWYPAVSCPHGKAARIVKILDRKQFKIGGYEKEICIIISTLLYISKPHTRSRTLRRGLLNGTMS